VVSAAAAAVVAAAVSALQPTPVRSMEAKKATASNTIIIFFILFSLGSIIFDRRNLSSALIYSVVQLTQNSSIFVYYQYSPPPVVKNVAYTLKNIEK
jgi:hypothetical protein